MAAHGAVPFGVGFVQVEVDPLLIHGVGTRVPRQRVHVAGSRFEAFERLGVVVQKNVLVVDVRMSEQQPRRCSEREAAVGAIRREPFIAAVRADGLRHVVQVRKRVHGKAAIPDAYLSVVEPQVLVGDDALGAQCEVAGYKSAVVCGADDLIGRKRFQTYEACIAEDAAHLLRSVQKQCYGLRVPDLLGTMKPRQRDEKSLRRRICSFEVFVTKR